MNKLNTTEKLKYIKESFNEFSELQSIISHEGKVNQFNKISKQLFPNIFKHDNDALYIISLYYRAANDLKKHKNSAITITDFYEQILLYEGCINKTIEELNKRYGHKRIIEIGRPNTVRLHTKGIKLTDFIKRNTYKIECFNNPVVLKQGNVAPQLMGVAVQTYFDIKNNDFKPLGMVDILPRWIEIADDYNYYENFKGAKNNQLIDFCILYADLVAHTRTFLPIDYFDVENVNKNDRWNLLQMVKNINRFMKKKKFNIKYSEVGFRYTNLIEGEKGIIENLCFGDLDFITDKNTILDIKCTSRNTPVTQLSQQLVYYMMGRLGNNTHGIKRSYFKSIHEIGCYNPKLDTYIYINLDEVSNKTLLQFFDRIMNYPIFNKCEGRYIKYERIINMICKEEKIVEKVIKEKPAKIKKERKIKEPIPKIKKERKLKSVVQIDLITEEVIKIWKSASEVERIEGFDNRRISDCCNGKRKSHKGYKWIFLKDYENQKGVN